MNALYAGVSPEAVASLRDNLSKLISLVNDSFAVDSRLCPAETPVCDWAFLVDLQRFWVTLPRRGDPTARIGGRP
jgi:hypothetical protein